MPEIPGTEAARPWTSPSGTAVSPPRTDAAAPARLGAAGSARVPGRRREFRQRPIPLRPMTVLELIDGAVGAVPTLPRFLLVRAALAISALGAVAFALTWWFNRAVATMVRAHSISTGTDWDGNVQFHLAPSNSERVSLVTTEILIAVVCSGFAATVVSGLFAPSVKAYVDAEPADAAALRALLRGRVARLWGLAVIVSLPRILTTALFGMMAWTSAKYPDSTVAGWYLLVTLCSGLPCFLLTATTAMAAPAAALEGIGISAALRRSRRLAGRGVPRVAWTCLLTLLIVALATTALDVFGRNLRADYGVGAQFAALPGSPGFSWWLLTYAVIYLLTLLLTTPYRAATAVLLYVDRRFRKEGLDIRIAWARLAPNAPRRTSEGPGA
jgi:hypothetical protein